MIPILTKEIKSISYKNVPRICSKMSPRVGHLYATVQIANQIKQGGAWDPDP